jgi:outer membrane protein assembly factor BamB
MKKTILGIAVAAAAFGGQLEISGFDHPESVLVDAKRVYVSNVGVKPLPMDKDGDGYISLVSKKGELINKNFLAGLNAPKGMALIGSTLYVADVDEVRGFDVHSKKQVFSLVFDGVKFLNDIVVKDANTLLVSGTDSGKIYEVNTKTKTQKVSADLPTANGIIYEKGKIYAVMLAKTPEKMFGGGGKLVEIDAKSGKVTELAKADGILDGIQKVGDTIYFSDWVKFEKAGVMRTYNLKTKAEGELALGKIGGPADFSIDKKENKIWIPKMIEGKVLVTDLK